MLNAMLLASDAFNNETAYATNLLMEAKMSVMPWKMLIDTAVADRAAVVEAIAAGSSRVCGRPVLHRRILRQLVSCIEEEIGLTDEIRRVTMKVTNDMGTK